MKDTIKMCLLSTMITFFVPAYPMEGLIEKHPLAPYEMVELIRNQQISTQVGDFLPPDYEIPLKEIQQDIDLFSKMSFLTISRLHKCHDSIPFFDDDPLLSDENFPLSLSIIQALEESDTKKRSKILKTIGNAVNQGSPLTSRRHFVTKILGQPTHQRNICIKSNRSDENSISVFRVMKDWIKERKKHLIYEKTEDFIPACSSVTQTIFDAAVKRKKYINGGFKKDMVDALEIQIPQVVIDLIFSWLHDKKNIALIEQEKQEFE